jgi:4-hydroxythreonine-4-phosphate dehydrogenase
MTRLAYTPGEPAGIGPDLAILLADQHQTSDLIIVADPELLQQRAAELGMPFNAHILEQPSDPLDTSPGMLNILPVPLSKPCSAGKTDAGNASYVLECLDKAISACLKGDCSGMVTGPVNKGVIHNAGFEFHGHTEYIAEKTGAEHPVMMLATDGLRVALATTHLPLRDVPAAITRENISATLDIINQSLKSLFAIPRPRILVCGLNPHAGDSGTLGREEIDTLSPVITDKQKQGLDIEGPLSADTIFSKANLERTDVFLAMYHDQGLPVLKYKGFGEAINVTLGLDIVRTSVDHGTALDLAGTGNIDCSSLKLAIQTARDMCEHRLH